MQPVATADRELATQDYRRRHGELSAYGRAANSSATLRRLLLFFVIGILGITFAVLAGTDISQPNSLAAGLLLLAVFSAAGLTLVWLYARKHFIQPDLAFRMWLQQVCDGDLDARIGLPPSHQHYKELNFHTRNLASALNRLSTDMESLVNLQTQRLKYQNKCLDLLFNLTADVSRETDQEAVFETVCQYLANWFGDAAVSIYLLNRDEQLSHGPIASGISQNHHEVQALEFKQLQVSHITHDSLANDRLRIRVPFSENTSVAGVICIETGNNDSTDKAEVQRVLTTISEQLNLFAAKQLAIQQSRTAQMIRDRTDMAAEIHDSLAQTLAALRYQTSLLGESVSNQSSADLHADVKRIEATVSEANLEVRELISEFRKPLVDRRSVDSIRATVDAFRAKSGMQVFFQTDDSQISFLPREESQMQRIIGEALNNAAKYSQASMLRVYLYSDALGIRRVLVEDDGIGFYQADEAGALEDSGGNHIGLSIMRERAAKVGATLEIESEPGEGTRIRIGLPPLAKFTRT